MNKTITPEVILSKFVARLRTKNTDLEYLVYMDKQFEKWLQCELVLAFSDIALPVVFTDNYVEITCDEDKEKVCDIAMEYPINCSGALISDVIVARNLFLLRYANKNTWQVPKDAVEECKKRYCSEKFHYIELKQRNWVDINAPADINEIVRVISTDLKKYSKQNCPRFKEDYNPSSIISMCLVSFWDPDAPPEVKPKRELARIAESVCTKALEECDKSYGKSGSFLLEHISEEIILLMVFYKL